MEKIRKVYNSQPYEIIYLKKLIEKQTGLKEKEDFEVEYCREDKTSILLNENKSIEFNKIDELFIFPILNDIEVKTETDKEKEKYVLNLTGLDINIQNVFIQLCNILNLNYKI